MTNKRILPINLYLLMTILGMVLWWPFPDVIYFMGVNSPIYVFMFAVGAERFWIGILALSWIAIITICIIVFYILARKYNKYTPFIIIVGLDLLISALVIGSKVYYNNYTGMGILLAGLAVHIVYYIWMIYWVYKVDYKENC